MRFLLSFLIFFSNFGQLGYATGPKSNKKPLKVAVIDTGLNIDYMEQTPLCDSGHKDFTGEGLNDIHGHGSNVTGLIVNTASISGYCIIVIKAYGFKNGKSDFITQALNYVATLGVNVINISGGGKGHQPSEYLAIKKLLNQKVTIIVAAGNMDMDLNHNCNYYPACYDKRIYVIGSTSGESNHGTMVDTVINGTNKEAFGVRMSGTSQSTAIFTGQMLKLALSLKTK